MKHQRDVFDMELGPIEKCVVEGDTVALDYKMYLTPKLDMSKMQKGNPIVLKVTEFNRFDHMDGCDEPMVVHLMVIATGLGPS